MKKLMGNIIRVLLSRTALNIYFWTLMVYIVWNNDAESRQYPLGIYRLAIGITTALLFSISAINNFWLMPRYLSHKKYRKYFTYIILATYAVSVLYIIVLKSFVSKYPNIKIYHLSLISTPADANWGIDNILGEVQWCAMGLGLWLLIMSMAWYARDYTRQQKLLEAVQKKQVETELSFLKQQVNPHFLFNTLNNLYGLALKKSDAAPDAILGLSSVLRYMLYESNTERVSFEKEKEVMQAYIAVELLRLPQGHPYLFTIEADKEYFLPPLLWLPVLENVFKHATRSISDNYYIEYHAEIRDNKLSIYSKNNSKPVTNGDTAKGIGFDNLRKRLQLLYPGKYSIDARQEGEYYMVNLEIDL